MVTDFYNNNKTYIRVKAFGKNSVQRKLVKELCPTHACFQHIHNTRRFDSGYLIQMINRKSKQNLFRNLMEQ